ncbi:hypothetical protein FRX31_034786 [Thalictrum thalictroides]|uniref:Reverse transcriptase n=1 Tax=Thalictrum thalictroides TaxID=46969 RepID=A0A7J6USW3_THATH|nr:hypothetical protein FRX31_034786 [Thalictrum thalictroides]
MEYEELRQKTNCTWMLKGDRCTAFFHGILKERRSNNKIWAVTDSQGNKCTEARAVQNTLVEHYKYLLGSVTDVDVGIIDELHVNSSLSMVEGEGTSLLAVQETLKLFSEATGLKLNCQKTTLLVGGMNDHDSLGFANSMGVQLVKPPVTYLGLPLTAVRISIREVLCDNLEARAKFQLPQEAKVSTLIENGSWGQLLYSLP